MDSEKKALMTRTYHAFMKIGLGLGESSLLHQIADEKIAGFGTAIDEKPRGITEVIQLIENQKAQSKSLDISWRIVPIAHYTTEHEDATVFADDLYLTIKAGNETFDMYVRISTVLHYVHGEWKVIHWHASKPEQVESQKDTWGLDMWKQKAEELKQLVEEKTADLLHKNRELQVEAALEKVRTVAMGMQAPEDMLSICKTISQQMEALGVEHIRNVQTAIFYPDRGTYMNYEYYAKHDKTFETEVDYKNHQIHLAFARKMMKGPGEEVREHLKGSQLHEWYAYQQTTNQFVDKFIPDAESLNYYWFSLGPVALGISTYAGMTEAEISLFKRFLKVFELSYQRYLDIEKALVQAKEAQTELALERIRAKVSAMMESKDLLDIVVSMRQEFVALGHEAHYFWYMRWLPDRYEKAMTSGDGTKIGMVMTLPRRIHGDIPLVADWEKSAAPALVYPMDVDAAIAYVHKMVELGNFIQVDPQAPTEEDLRHINGLTFVMARTTQGEIGYSLPGFVTNPPAADISTLIRFAGVFDLAYRRFEDLQDAEKRHRETQIELALERVRARSMAMRKSEELLDVINVISEQLIQLRFRFRFVTFGFLSPEGALDFWLAAPGFPQPERIHMPPTTNPITQSVIEAKNQGLTFMQHSFHNDLTRDWMRLMFDHNPDSRIIGASRQLIEASPGLHWASVLMKDILVFMGNFGMKPYSEDQHAILIRFARAFEQSYTRFLDLQKAEAQAREAQIEAALERVRSRTMAMHKSDELTEVASLLFKQIRDLGITAWTTGFNVWSEDNNSYVDYVTDPEGNFIEPYTVDTTQAPVLRAMRDAKKSGQDFYVNHEEGDAIKETYRVLMRFGQKGQYEKLLASGFQFPEKQYNHFAFGEKVSLLFITYEPVPEAHQIFKRFCKVFEQTYTRFLDLQKAEAQARESQIQLALERVRARTMAMQRSEELPEVAALLFQQVKTLGVPQFHCGFNIFEIDDTECTWYPGSAEGDILPPCKIPLTEHPVFMAFNESRKRGDELFVYEKDGEYQAGHYRYMLSLPVLGEILQNMLDAGIPFPTFQIDHIANFSHGNLLFITAEHVPEMHDTFKRFAKVFEQTYTRFLDLQKAEAQARDAQIEAALEKVRSRTMAMQSSDELADAAYTLFEQLNALGVTHERINIGIVNEENQTIDFWVTEQGGKKLNTKFSGRISEPTTLSKAYAAWKKGEKSIMIDLQGEALADWLRFMNEEIKIPFNKAYLHNRRVQTAGFFSKGMLVVTNPEPLQDEALYLLEKFAGVFDLTYTRFNDLKIAEAHALQAEKDLQEIKAARQKAEQALNELKATQAQLVQQEKLASLGQLTAGIAHEIQNPLNFVNNFSEINAELSEEILEAASKGDIEEVKALAIDIRSNQEKIREHGKRADSIVKGMLQHSLSSTGTKEPTDMNKLADEYLRLAYHGMRAKEKDFNADITTDFDPALPTATVMPQEIGRVILNLVNNAFYAVNEQNKAKSGQPGTGYKPQVTVRTRSEGDKIDISVKDNGKGIPDSIREKIFQPFFTTKPTGQGTGLGLSLSYDIVTKGHGGELKMETKEEEGTTFHMLLPIR